MKRKITLIFLSLVCALSLAVGLTACENSGTPSNNFNNSFYSVQSAYSKAVELGYTGSLEEFISSISGKDGTDGTNGADGVGISDITINDEGELIVTLTVGGEINLGKINDSDPDGGESHTHSLVKTEAVAATCTTDGNITYWYCSDCGKYFSDAAGTNEISLDDTVIAATGLHIYEDSYICTVCGHELNISEGLEYTLSDNGKYYILSGKGLCKDTNVVIPYTYNGLPVTAIAETNFFNIYPYVTSVTIPSSVTFIGERAFFNCTSLVSVTIPNSVTSIGAMAFYNCESLTSITIPDSVTTIGNGAFQQCFSLKYNEYENGYYLGNDNNKNIILIDVIDETITSFTINSSTKIVYDYAFYNCTSLTCITIPDSVTSIGDRAFENCTSLTSITIPNSVTSMGNITFQGCTSLASIIIPDSVIYIGEEEFNRCTSLTSITIPNSVTSIGSSAFSGCTSLTSITIPDSVTSIGEGAFKGCTSLTNIAVNTNSTFYKSIDGNLYNNDETTLISYVAGKTDTSFIIPDSVTSIGYGAFYGCTSLTSITIPDSVTSIGSGAFEYCTSLTSITIPDSVTSIGSFAFEGCTSLASIIIPDSVNSIDSYAFYKCTSLTSITIPDSVTSIGSYAFDGCTALTTVYYNGTVDEWNEMSIRSGNSYLTSATIYYYSESEPDYTDGYNYWHYVNGEIVVWAQ